MNNFDNDFKDAIKSESDFSHIKYLKTALGRDVNYKKSEHLIYTPTYHNAFKHGARWAREFTMGEVIKFISKWKEDLEVDYFDNDGELQTEKLIDCIESHFKDRSDE